MPDLEALNMVNNNAGPALSATSDMPVVDLGVADKPAEPEAPETPEVAPPAVEPTEVAEAQPEPEAPAKPKKTGVQERFGELTQQRKDAEARAAEADALRAQRDAELAAANAEIQRLKTPPPAEPERDPRPQRAAFNDPDAYEDALLSWSAKQAAREAQAEFARQQAETAQRTAAENQQQAIQRQQQIIAQTYQENVEPFKAEHPDYDDVVNVPTLTITPIMGQIIMAAKNGPAIAYHLGSNPKEAARIAALPPPQVALEIAELAVTLRKPPPATKAPPPVVPVGSRNGAVEKSPDAMTMDEYAAMRREQRIAAARGR